MSAIWSPPVPNECSEALPSDLVLVPKSIQLLRAPAFGSNVNVSLMHKWRPIALEVIAKTEYTRTKGIRSSC